MRDRFSFAALALLASCAPAAPEPAPARPLVVSSAAPEPEAASERSDAVDAGFVDSRWDALVQAELVWDFTGLECKPGERGILAAKDPAGEVSGAQLLAERGCRRMGKGFSHVAPHCCPEALSAPEPHSGGAKSCELAVYEYVRDRAPISGEEGEPRTTGGQYGAVLNRGTYFRHCSLPDESSISICTAVLDGRPVGITVGVKPPNPRAADCVARGVAGLTFPSSDKLDVTFTTF